MYNHQHVFVPSIKHPHYEFCKECESYHSVAQIDPKIVYEESDYWDTGDGKTGRSTLEQQAANFVCIDDCGISKADRIMQFVPNGETALEIACAPGTLLKMLTDKGYNAFGIEPSTKYIDFILSQAPKSKVIHGYFPDATKGFEDGCFDCIIGSDVMEHFDDYDSFFKETHRLLKLGGTMVIMSPIILTDGLFRKIDFNHPDQHAWIHTQKHLEPYLKEMFAEVKFSRWIVGHEIIVAKK